MGTVTLNQGVWLSYWRVSRETTSQYTFIVLVDSRIKFFNGATISQTPTLGLQETYMQVDSTLACQIPQDIGDVTALVADSRGQDTDKILKSCNRNFRKLYL